MLECPKCHEIGGLDNISGQGFYCWSCDEWIGEVDTGGVGEEVYCGHEA